MFTVAVISQKGGAGKTTLALNLAVAAERRRRATLVVDVDPQGSAAAWAKARDADTPVVTAIQAHALEATLATGRAAGARLALIDTAPLAEQVALAAARAADFVLIPCRPSIFDLRAITASADIATIAGTPAAAVLNGVPARGQLAADAEAALRQRGIAVAPVRLGQRADFVHAATASRGVVETTARSKAADEIGQLLAWLRRVEKRTGKRRAGAGAADGA